MIYVPREYGQIDYVATPEEVMLFFSDPDALFAKVHEVSKSEYRDWVESDFTAYCSGTTRAGRPCRNQVNGGYYVPIKKWLALQGQYCTVHSGERETSLMPLRSRR